MANMWRKAQLYLGLGPDDEYEDYDPAADRPVAPVAPARPAPPTRTATEPQRARPAPPVKAAKPAGAVKARPVAAAPPPEEVPAVRPLPPPATAAAAPPPPSSSAPPPPSSPPVVGSTPTAEGEPAKPRTVVRPVPAPATAKPHVVTPTSFNDAQEVADRYKANQPVILNLQGVERDLARRLIDFTSGLCYGLGGQMEKVGNQVYLVAPANVEVSAEERRRLAERGLHGA